MQGLIGAHWHKTLLAKTHLTLGRQRKLTAWLFILPALLFHFLVIGIPALGSIYYSMTQWSGISMTPEKFIGLKNFEDLFSHDEIFPMAFSHNLIWMVLSIGASFALGLGIAALLAQSRLGQRRELAIRGLLFLPNILPAVIVAYMWARLLQPQRGIGALLMQAGLPWNLKYPLLGSPDTALVTVISVTIWRGWPFLMVLFLTAMQTIPPELYDAAKVDGAGAWQQFYNVTIPGIMPAVFFMLMMSAIWSFSSFQYVWLMTGGGPAYSTELLGTMLYKNLVNNFRAGYASAIGMTITALSGALIGLFTLIRKRYEI
ncbi:MAG: sugar ABC transporter permease [Chloroflexi bacterium]|nr:sugar ABC transporter permease [Chloroflexota bacterium]